jgi:hypothetical protein
MRDCQPAPVDLKYSTTSRLYRTDRSNFGLSDFGLPRSARNGTIDLSCFGESGWASGSAFAAARILRSSACVGIAILERLDVFDIVLNLTTRRGAETDDPASVTAVDECHVIKGVGLRGEGDHAQLVVPKAMVDPSKRSVPVKFPRQTQRHAVSGTVRRVFGGIELDSHELV